MASNHQQDEQRLALFIDFENIAIGVRDAHYRKFDINLVLERLLEKGKVLVKKAYADWSRYSDYKRAFHEAAIELIEVPQKSVGGKNSADIRLVVDAMDMSFQKEHIDCFVVCSGDSDFSPLVSKLKENNKYVIGLGVKNSTSDLLIENCDEFIFYEDLVRGQQRQIPVMSSLPEKVQEAFSLLVDAVLALQRENKEVLWGSMVKETMKRKKPSFNETYYGFRTFSHLLEEAQRKGIVTLRRDQKSGSYIVEDLGTGAGTGATTLAARGEARGEAASASAAAAGAAAATAAAETAVPLAATGTDSAEPAANGVRTPRRRRSRGRRPRGSSTGTVAGYPETPATAGADDGTDVDDHDDHEEMEDDAAHAEASDPGREPGPAAEQSAAHGGAGRGEPLRIPRPRRRYAGAAVLAVLVDSPRCRGAVFTARRAVQGRPGGLSPASALGRLAPPRAALARGRAGRAAEPGRRRLARARRTPIFRTSSTRAMLRPRGMVRPVSHPKIEPGLTPSSRENCSRVMRSRARRARMSSPDRRAPRPRRPPEGTRDSRRPKLRSTERSPRRLARAARRSFFIWRCIARSERKPFCTSFAASRRTSALSAAASVFTFT